MALPISILGARIHYIFPQKDLFDVCEICFGKVIGKIIILLFTLYTFYWSSDVATNYGEFVRTVSFPETPRIIPMAFIFILCAFAIKESVETLGRFSAFL